MLDLVSKYSRRKRAFTWLLVVARLVSKHSSSSPLLQPSSGRGTSDPYAVITKLPNNKDKEGENVVVLGRTETMQNSLSPNWVKVFVVDYELGTPFHFAVTVMDETENKQMGYAVFSLGEILGSRGSTKARVLQKGQGTIFATARKSTGAGTLRLKLRGEKVSNLFMEYHTYVFIYISVNFLPSFSGNTVEKCRGMVGKIGSIL